MISKEYINEKLGYYTRQASTYNVEDIANTIFNFIMDNTRSSRENKDKEEMLTIKYITNVDIIYGTVFFDHIDASCEEYEKQLLYKDIYRACDSCNNFGCLSILLHYISDTVFPNFLRYKDIPGFKTITYGGVYVYSEAEFVSRTVNNIKKAKFISAEDATDILHVHIINTIRYSESGETQILSLKHIHDLYTNCIVFGFLKYSEVLDSNIIKDNILEICKYCEKNDILEDFLNFFIDKVFVDFVLNKPLYNHIYDIKLKITEKNEEC